MQNNKNNVTIVIHVQQIIETNVGNKAMHYEICVFLVRNGK